MPSTPTKYWQLSNFSRHTWCFPLEPLGGLLLPLVQKRLHVRIVSHEIGFYMRRHSLSVRQRRNYEGELIQSGSCKDKIRTKKLTLLQVKWELISGPHRGKDPFCTQTHTHSRYWECMVLNSLQVSLECVGRSRNTRRKPTQMWKQKHKLHTQIIMSTVWTWNPLKNKWWRGAPPLIFLVCAKTWFSVNQLWEMPVVTHSSSAAVFMLKSDWHALASSFTRGRMNRRLFICRMNDLND